MTLAEVLHDLLDGVPFNGERRAAAHEAIDAAHPAPAPEPAPEASDAAAE